MAGNTEVTMGILLLLLEFCDNILSMQFIFCPVQIFLRHIKTAQPAVGLGELMTGIRILRRG
jgi:hypothetical protein